MPQAILSFLGEKLWNPMARRLISRTFSDSKTPDFPVI
jgi:hypothetical protein